MEACSDIDRVLVVDDDDLSRHVVARRLLRWGYQPVPCANAEGAIAELGRGMVTALVSDLHMPGMDGLALVRAALALRPELPVFLLTACPTPALWAQARAAGARDLLVKRAGRAEGLRRALGAALAPEDSSGGEDVQLAHALRTPLTALKGAIDILCSGQLGDLPESQRRFAAIAQRNADRMISLIEELLEASARG